MKVRALRRYQQARMAHAFRVIHEIWDGAYTLDALLRAKKALKGPIDPLFKDLPLGKIETSATWGWWSETNSSKLLQKFSELNTDLRAPKSAKATIVHIPKSIADGAYLVEHGFGVAPKVLLLGGMPRALDSRRLSPAQLEQFLTSGGPILVDIRPDDQATQEERDLHAQVKAFVQQAQSRAYNLDVEAEYGLRGSLDQDGHLQIDSWNLINPSMNN